MAVQLFHLTIDFPNANRVPMVRLSSRWVLAVTISLQASRRSMANEEGGKGGADLVNFPPNNLRKVLEAPVADIQGNGIGPVVFVHGSSQYVTEPLMPSVRSNTVC